MDQLHGAEKWLRERPEQVYLDKHCKHRFPLPLPPLVTARYHRIAVTRGSADACRRFYGGSSSASLLITSDVTGQNADREPILCRAGSGDEAFRSRSDETTLDILMGELDTVADFVAYLNKKEAFYDSPRTACFWRVAKNRS